MLSTTPSVQKYVIVPGFSDIRQTVTSSTNVTGTSGLKSSRFTFSPVQLCWASIPALRPVVGLLMDLSANTNNSHVPSHKKILSKVISNDKKNRKKSDPQFFSIFQNLRTATPYLTSCFGMKVKSVPENDKKLLREEFSYNSIS